MKLRISEINKKACGELPHIFTYFIVQEKIDFFFFKFWSTRGYYYGETNFREYKFTTYEAASSFVEGYCKKQSFRVIKEIECEGI